MSRSYQKTPCFFFTCHICRESHRISFFPFFNVCYMVMHTLLRSHVTRSRNLGSMIFGRGECQIRAQSLHWGRGWAFFQPFANQMYVQSLVMYSWPMMRLEVANKPNKWNSTKASDLTCDIWTWDIWNIMYLCKGFFFPILSVLFFAIQIDESIQFKMPK